MATVEEVSSEEPSKNILSVLSPHVKNLSSDEELLSTLTI